jgi:hypothetical protein
MVKINNFVLHAGKKFYLNVLYEKYNIKLNVNVNFK